MSYPGQPPMGIPGMPPMPYMVGAPPPIIGGVMPMPHVSNVPRTYFDKRPLCCQNFDRFKV